MLFYLAVFISSIRLSSQVTSFRPLRAYLYRSAFARFSSVPFSMDGDDISNTVIHLTNVAIQKTAEGIGFNAIKPMRNVIILLVSI